MQQTEHLILPHEPALLKDLVCSNPYTAQRSLALWNLLLVLQMHKEKLNNRCHPNICHSCSPVWFPPLLWVCPKLGHQLCWGVMQPQRKCDKMLFPALCSLWPHYSSVTNNSSSLSTLGYTSWYNPPTATPKHQTQTKRNQENLYKLQMLSLPYLFTWVYPVLITLASQGIFSPIYLISLPYFLWCYHHQMNWCGSCVKSPNHCCHFTRTGLMKDRIQRISWLNAER